MAKALTAFTIANLKPRPKSYEKSDGGCAGLRVTVFPSGKKSFIVRYRYRGLQRKLTLGPCLLGAGADQDEPTDTPELNTPLSLRAARELATKALRQAKAKNGSDPAAAKQRARQEELARESDTLGAIAQEYLRRVASRFRTFAQRKSDLDLVCAVLGRLPVAEIRRGQYTRILDHIADHNGPVRSDRCLSALRTLLSWHSARSDFISPLVRGGRRTSISERARSRILSDDELKAVVLTAEAEQRKGNPFGGFVLFLLHTATRRSEAAALTRGELSDGGRTWTIPAARYKSNRDTVVPLSPAASAIVAAQPVLGDFVFSTDGSRPLGDFANHKRKFDQASGITGWRLHDTRRTARTLLSRAGISADIAEMCLGHALVGIRGTYDRFQYRDEKARAFESLAALIARIAHPPADDVVVPMRAGAKRARRK